jgi:hypothetical protein
MFVVFTCIEGGAIVIVTGTTTGLPAIGRPLAAFVAVIVTLVEYDLSDTPLALTTTLKDVFAPAARLEPDAGESETQVGVPLCSATDQLSGLPPVLVR